jgi:hypothetical protein
MSHAAANMGVMADGRDDAYSELAQLADAAAVDSEWEHQIVEAIVGDFRDDEERQRLAEAFRFHAREDKADSERFGPMFTFEGGATVPAPLPEVPDDTCSLWAAVADHATHPRVRARLHDLLFERKWPDIGGHAAAAVEAYLEDVADIDPPSQRTVDGLRRSHHLARLTRREDLAARVTAALLGAAAVSIDDAEPKPGVALRLLEVLVAARCPDPTIDELLDHARDRYADAWNAESVIDLQRRRAASGDARKDLDRELVELWLDEAERADPLVAVMHREKAAKLARERGLPDLVDRAVLAMQAAGPPELARIEIEVPQSLTPEQIEEYIESMVGDTWWDSVLRVLAHGPPSGDVGRNRKTATDLAKEHPLQALLPKVRLGGDGLPRYTPRTDDDQVDDQLTDMETMGLQWHGQLMAEALRRASAKYDPSVEDVADALGAVKCEGSTAAAIGRVVRRFTEGDYEGAAYTGIPLVERQCRELLLAIDAPLYRVQRERAPGTYPGLGALLPLLAERGLDESWYRFLRTLLSAPNGWNFRNEALHGFIDDVGWPGAGLVLIAVLYLTLLRPHRGPDDGESPVDE